VKDCNQCGKCCIKYGGGDLAATKQDIDNWESFHPEIYKYVQGDEIWFDPQSGKPLEQCPFLEIEQNTNGPKKYTCSIYLHRPEDCRLYPSLITEMIRDECEMIDATDLLDTKRAQRKLDELMHESRRAKYNRGDHSSTCGLVTKHSKPL